MIMPERQFNAGTYRHGFNGKENDNEVKGVGNQQNYGMRIYDGRIARFLSVDPLTKNYPWYTPYQFAGNMPINCLDLDGLEEMDYRDDPQLLTRLLLTTWFDVKHSVMNLAFRMPDNVPGRFNAGYKFEANGNETFETEIKFVPDDNLKNEALNTALDVANVASFGKTGGDASSLLFSKSSTAPQYTRWARNIMKFSNNTFHTASGLIFKLAEKENRFSHVQKHLKNDMSRGYHGIFTLGEDLVANLDLAWEMVKKGEKNVSISVNPLNGNLLYTVDMGKKVGIQGGKLGKGEELNKILIVIEKGTESDVVTAFPVR